MAETPRWLVAGTPIDEPYPRSVEIAWSRENAWWIKAFGSDAPLLAAVDPPQPPTSEEAEDLGNALVALNEVFDIERLD